MARILYPGISLACPTFIEKLYIPPDKVRTLFSAPPTIVQAPPNLVPIPRYLTIRREAGAAYTLGGGTTFVIRHKNLNGTTRNLISSLLTLTSFLNGTTEKNISRRTFFENTSIDFPGTTTDSWGAALEITTDGSSDPTGGDGGLDLRLIWEGLPKQLPWF